MSAIGVGVSWFPSPNYRSINSWPGLDVARSSTLEMTHVAFLEPELDP